MALLLGARIRAFHGAIPLWAMLERLETSLPLGPTGVRAPARLAVLAVAACQSIRTPLARARYVALPIGLRHSLVIFVCCL
jgi:hypothetical protein